MDVLPSYQLHLRRLDPSLAELHLHFPDLPEGVEVRGRLMGPRCPGISTVEIAYHLRPLGEAGWFQVVIPDPTFWTDEKPYVYEGPIEFHKGGAKAGARHVSLGLRLGGNVLET